LDCATSNPDGYTRDCPPFGDPNAPDGDPAKGDFLGTIGVDLSPLRTAGRTVTTLDGGFCPEQGTSPGQTTDPPKLGCFGQEPCRSITETGTPAGLLTPGTPNAVTLASVFCIPAVPGIAGQLVNSAADLPGPGAVSLPGTFLLTPRE